ncbi:hypothetical protein KDL27_06615 [Pseudomonas syringae pv. syringae]|uniref:Uncharacterized protein n=1 Tax=Pseudomonas syringae pv. syringae TaxID=321 RepID=A0AB35JKG1_PSESY|nr:hypothetical protein [Pseudomonas syringae]MDC3735451.1 hypothetical protein [Pseudomonas syringae pv. syringae]
MSIANLPNSVIDMWMVDAPQHVIAQQERCGMIQKILYVQCSAVSRADQNYYGLLQSHFAISCHLSVLYPAPCRLTKVYLSSFFLHKTAMTVAAISPNASTIYRRSNI